MMREDPPPTKKRRSHDSTSLDDDKKRGRPRVEKRDETAADKRRTQIRLAQRAYRQRKESTLEELRKRVSELSRTLELMNKAFVDCQDRLSASGLSDEQLQDLHDTSMQYKALMKTARNPEEDRPISPTIEDRHISASPRSAGEHHRMMEPQNVPSWMDGAFLDNPPEPAGGPAEVGMGYTMYAPAVDNRVSPETDSFGLELSAQSLVPALPQKSAVPAVFSTLPVELSPPRTYSFHETTFGRRLHRACLEQGYQLLLDPARRPGAYERCFRLSLMGRDRHKLIKAMKMMLDRGPHESLELWEAPLIHVGGAGTHYARRDQFGKLQPKLDSYNLGIIGPQSLALLEDAARDKASADMTVDLAGFEGEWFDPYDVEGYLAEKGIHIDPSSSFAEAEVVEWSASPSDASTISSASAPKTPSQDLTYDFDFGQMPDFSGMDFSDVGFSDVSTGSWMNFLQPGQAAKEQGPATTVVRENQSQVDVSLFAKAFKPQVPIQVRKKTIIVDIQKFVKVLTVSGVCIGRTPGFRRRDVDRALELASIDAF